MIAPVNAPQVSPARATPPAKELPAIKEISFPILSFSCKLASTDWVHPQYSMSFWMACSSISSINFFLLSSIVFSFLFFLDLRILFWLSYCCDCLRRSSISSLEGSES